MKSRLSDTEEWIRDLEDSIMESKSKEETERQNFKKTQLTRPMRQQKSCQPSHNRDSRRKRKRKGGWKYIWRNYGLKLFKSKKEVEIQVQEALRVLNKMNTNRFIPRHITLQMAKIKGNKRILNAAREKERINQNIISISYQLISLKKLCRPEGGA